MCHVLSAEINFYVTKNCTFLTQRMYLCMCVFCFVPFFCLRSAAVSLQGNLTFNCCAEVALPDVPVLMRREDEETAVCTDNGKKKERKPVLLLSICSPMQSVTHSAENLTLCRSLLW